MHCVAQKDASTIRLRRMDLAHMGPPEECAFDTENALDRDDIGAARDQDTLEMLYVHEPAKLRYVVGLMLRMSKYSFKRQSTYVNWHRYAARVYNEVRASGHPEVLTLDMFASIAVFARQCERRRRRAESADKNREARKHTAKKAAVTRARNRVERPIAKAAFAETDAAFEDVFGLATSLVNSES